MHYFDLDIHDIIQSHAAKWIGLPFHTQHRVDLLHMQKMFGRLLISKRHYSASVQKGDILMAKPECNIFSIVDIGRLVVLQLRVCIPANSGAGGLFLYNLKSVFLATSPKRFEGDKSEGGLGTIGPSSDICREFLECIATFPRLFMVENFTDCTLSNFILTQLL